MNAARQKGGLATKARYGADNFYSIIGKLGGRPPLKSISELLAERQQALKSSGKNKSKKGEWPPRSRLQNIREIKGLSFSL